MSDDLAGFWCLLSPRPSHQCRTAAPILLYRVPTVLAPGEHYCLMLVVRQHLWEARSRHLCLVVADRIDPVRRLSLWQYRLLWVLAYDDALSKW